ncbi:MAG: hypothetical protein WDO17_19450 [Alphaproteobacteria bacterium]
MALGGDSATLTSVGYAAGNRNSSVGTVPPGMLLASFDTGGHLVLESSSSDNAIDIASTSPTVLAELGLSVGTVKPTNLLTQSAAAQGQTMNIQVGTNPALAITFGTGGGEVSTMAELQAKLNTLTGGTATVGQHERQHQDRRQCARRHHPDHRHGERG